MTIKTRVLAAAAAMALLSGPAAVGASAASAATPSCGANCINVFSREFGTHGTPAFVLDTLRQGNKAGQPLILFRTSDTDPAEDFNASFQGLTSDFYAAGLVSSAVALHYGCVLGGTPVAGAEIPCSPAGGTDDAAFEDEYAPYGVDSGLCAGVATAAAAGTKVALEPCGVSSKTVWIVDTGDSVTVTAGYVPLINGSDTNFSHPYVLTYPSNGYPTDTPRVQLTTQELTGFTGSLLVPVLGTVDDNQLWGADLGVLK
jgi:hypothetical protein